MDRIDFWKPACIASFLLYTTGLILLLTVPHLTLPVHRDGWFIMMLLEHGVNIALLSLPTLGYLVYFWKWVAEDDKPSPSPTEMSLANVLLLLSTFIMLHVFFGNRIPQLGSEGQHYWLATFIALQTVPPMIPLLWAVQKKEPHIQY